jgi:hypothetical protein
MYSNPRILIVVLLITIVFSLSYKIIATNRIAGRNTRRPTNADNLRKETGDARFQPSTFKTYDNANMDIEYHDSPKNTIDRKLNDPITIKYSDGTSKTFRFGDVAGECHVL